MTRYTYHLPKIHVSRRAYDAIIDDNPGFLRRLFESSRVASAFWGVAGVTIHADCDTIREIEAALEKIRPTLAKAS